MDGGGRGRGRAVERGRANARWCHPDVGLGSMVGMVGGFIDILILASGYQSNGRPSWWEATQVAKALEWGCLFEQVIGKLSICKEGKESRRALDIALLDLIACIDYPPGLPKLSADILANARKLFVDVFVGAYDVGQGRLMSFLSAVQGQGWVQDYALQIILKRYLTFSCIKSLSSTLDAASHGSAKLQKSTVRGYTIWKDDADLLSKTSPRYLISEQEDYFCQQWRQNSLSYLLNTNTLYKLSGALEVFKADLSQWRKVFNTLLEFADEELKSRVIDIAELCCLQLAVCKWTTLTEMLLCSEASTSNLWQWSKQELDVKGHWASNAMASERCAVEAYLEAILSGFEYLLWKLPPILIASALSHGSTLFTKYLSSILQELDTVAIPPRCTCPCKIASKNQSSRYAAERLWCIQISN